MRQGPTRSMMAARMGSDFLRWLMALRMDHISITRLRSWRTKNESKRLMSCKGKPKTDLAPQPRLRSHELFDGLDEVVNRGVVTIDMTLQFAQLGGELAVGSQHFAEPNEGANHENTHLNCAFGVEHSCSHDCAVLGEGMWAIAPPAV